MNTFCGLDFGTSNSTIGVFSDQKCQLVPLDNGKPILRSAIFCDAEQKEWVFGQEGVDRYLESTPGRLMMSLKSVLGSSLMREETLILGEFVSYADILRKFVQHVKFKAELLIEQPLTHAVFGRPVHFHDTNQDSDKEAEATLAEIAQQLGYKEVSFQYEPIAAALVYETTLAEEQLALIVDMGGGTSDFSVIRLRPGNQAYDRKEDVLANAGIHIAGTDFDYRLSLRKVMPLLGLGSQMTGSSGDIEVPSFYYHDLTTWHTLTQLYNTKTISHVESIRARAHEKHLLDRLISVLKLREGHRALEAVEKCKQQLSQTTQQQLGLSFIEHDLSASVTRDEFNQIISEDINKIVDKVLHTLKLANVKAADINAIFYTGGSTKIPLIHEKINPLFPKAIIMQGDAFGSVGLGLTLEAERRYR